MKDTRKKSPGAPRQNRNSMRHGLKSSRLPPGCRHIENRLNTLRRQLEDAVVACRGQVSIQHAATIMTAIRWERHAALAQRWLTLQDGKLKPSEQLFFSREVATASAARDRAIAELELDGDAQPMDLKKYLESKGQQ